MSCPNREGKTYQHCFVDSIILVVKSLRMSAGTSRHTVLVLDPGKAMKGKRSYISGDQVEIDEVPMQKWDQAWKEI